MVDDIPSLFNITFMKNARNDSGILGSKAVGEPPYIIANSLYFATKMAIASARRDDNKNEFLELDVPASVAVRHSACSVNPSRFIMPNSS